MSVVIETASEEDVSALLAVEKRCFAEPWTVQFFIEELTGEYSLCFKAVDRPDGGAPAVVGFIIASLMSGELYIGNIAVLQEFRGRGTGRLMLETVLNAGEFHTAYLEVEKSNTAAVGLYISCGFSIAGEIKGYYEHYDENGRRYLTPAYRMVLNKNEDTCD